MQEYIPILVPAAMLLLTITIIAAYGFRKHKRRPKPWCKVCDREMVIRNWDGMGLDLVCPACGRTVNYRRER